jgi:hypothetical protein
MVEAPGAALNAPMGNGASKLAVGAVLSALLIVVSAGYGVRKGLLR